MTDERVYGEAEVAEIFEKAATSSTRASEGPTLSSARGFSLAELQAIGGEVGIAPSAIAEAAAALELRRSVAPRKTYLGMPVAVGRTVELPRAPDDREWEMLLAELRATFSANGKDRSSGGVRGWTNGNLHAYVEPTESGHRLRLGTTSGNGMGTAQMGLLGLAAALLMLVFFFLSGELAEEGAVAALFAAMGLFALGTNALRLPRWAQEREEQMEHIAARARTIIRPDPQPAALPDGG